MGTKEIVIVLTNKGYVAIEDNQIFDLWKNKPIKVIYEELHQRYPNYKVHLGSMDLIEFQHAVEISNQYLNDHEQLKFINSQNINLKNNNKMKQLTFNAKTASTLAKITVGFTTQKLSGAFHLTLQTGADVLQFGANTIAKGEATVLTKLRLYKEPEAELIKIRQERTKGYQDLVKHAPKKLFVASGVIKDRLENLIASHKIKSVNEKL